MASQKWVKEKGKKKKEETMEEKRHTVVSASRRKERYKGVRGRFNVPVDRNMYIYIARVQRETEAESSI